MGDDPECYALNLLQGECQSQAIHKLLPANDQGKQRQAHSLCSDFGLRTPHLPCGNLELLLSLRLFPQALLSFLLSFTGFRLVLRA